MVREQEAARARMPRRSGPRPQDYAPGPTSMLDGLHRAAKDPKNVVVQNHSSTSATIRVSRTAYA